MDLVLMGTRDARRLGVVQAAADGRISNREGAAAVGLSVRQFRRLRSQVRDSGPSGVVHGNRGRPSPRRLSATVRDRVVALLTGEVKLNDHHLSELLAEDEEDPVVVSPASVRRIRRSLKLAPKRRRRPAMHRRRRSRKARRGELVLVDGSPFQWFDAQGPHWSLMGAIDDATSAILHLTLRPTEDLHGYVELLRGVVAAHGVPVCLYGDRSGILVRNDKHWSLGEELRGTQDPTQFGRMLAELGTGFIPARSPQAKGRIERLWATLQDRLVAELRLRGINTLAAAHDYLPRFIATTTGAARWRPRRRAARSGAHRATSNASSPASMTVSWPATTRCASPADGCRSHPARTADRGTRHACRFANCSTADCSSSIHGMVSSPRNPRPRARSSSSRARPRARGSRAHGTPSADRPTGPRGNRHHPGHLPGRRASARRPTSARQQRNTPGTIASHPMDHRIAPVGGGRSH
jgi:transposase